MLSLRHLRALPTIVAIAAFALLVVAFTSAVGGAPAATTARGATATVALSPKAAGSLALKKAGVKVSAKKPASVTKTRWALPLFGTPPIDATSIALEGELRFGVGKRQVSFIGMRLSFGAKPTITGALGKKKYTVLTLGGAPKRDVAGRTIRFDKTSISLSSSAAKQIRKQLKLKRVVTGRIGTLSLTAAATPSVTPPTPTSTSPTTTTTVAPPPPPVTTTTTTPPPVTTTTPTTTTPVDPPAPCWAATPAGSTDWIACDEPGGSQFGYGNLRSWINYILGWNDAAASVVATDGASPVAPTDRYDYRLPVASTLVEGDGTVTVAHTGRIQYTLPMHGVDIYVEDLVFHVAADRHSARVTLTARYTPRPTTSDPAPAVVTEEVEAMAVDLDAARSKTTAAGVTTYEHAPATLTEAGREIWGPDSYPQDAAWGAFTLAVPD